ncbi:MAG TPA: hypothetical protein VGJ27_07030 [Gaiellaceae bacterium]
MSSGAFLLAFSLGAAALALWIFVCLPKLAPTSLTRAFGHVVAAMVVGVLLKPALTGMAESGFPLAVFTALFGVALPGLTYMFVAGAWLLRAMSAGLSR